MAVISSTTLDIYRNLAVEQWLMEHTEEPVLYLWHSDCAVVMGKNQNPWRECRLDLMEAEGVPLARRISGGGTVYHDLGNLNYCVIVKRAEYREARAFEMILGALEQFGVTGRRASKSNLLVEGRKFSGNAFAFLKGRVMHHGTLLLNSDLERLERYLGPVCKGIETRAIASVPAKVANLQLDEPLVSEAIQQQFSALYEIERRSGEIVPDEEQVAIIVERIRSTEWLYGATPLFSIKKGGEEWIVEKGFQCRNKLPMCLARPARMTRRLE